MKTNHYLLVKMTEMIIQSILSHPRTHLFDTRCDRVYICPTSLGSLFICLANLWGEIEQV